MIDGESFASRVSFLIEMYICFGKLLLVDMNTAFKVLLHHFIYSYPSQLCVILGMQCVPPFYIFIATKNLYLRDVKITERNGVFLFLSVEILIV